MCMYMMILFRRSRVTFWIQLRGVQLLRASDSLGMNLYISRKAEQLC
jgi:hypothetical protein